jgi:integrase
VKNWEEYCDELGYDPHITFGKETEERIRMTKRITGWMQWNSERRVTSGKRTGKLAIKSADTFNTYLAALIRATKEEGEEWHPTIHLDRVKKRINRQYKKGTKRKLPIFVSMVDRMEKEKVLNVETKEDLQGITILLLSIFGLLRISEILNLEWEDLRKETIRAEDARGHRKETKIITVTLRDTKTMRYNGGLPENTVLCERGNFKKKGEGTWDPLQMLDQVWNRRSKKRKAERRMKIFDMDRDTYNKLLKRSLERIGVRSKAYSTHSGRIGGATMLWEGGASDAEIKEFGRWRSDTWKIYCRQAKSKCLKLAAMISRSNLRENSLVSNEDKWTIEIDKR